MQTLVQIGGKSITDLCRMPLQELTPWFEHLTLTDQEQYAARHLLGEIRSRLRFMQDVGLGYLTLNRAANTLSGGESQRIKLASELSKRDTGKTVYILDEPTTGLHFEDIRILMQVLQKLVDRGNTVIIIEHNLDVIRQADWIIDMGPEGGRNGGQILSVGTPEEVAKSRKGYTPQFIASVLQSPDRDRNDA